MSGILQVTDFSQDIVTIMLLVMMSPRMSGAETRMPQIVMIVIIGL